MPDEIDDRDHRLNEVTAEYLERKSGTEPNIRSLREETLVTYPDFKEELTAFFKDEDILRPSQPDFGNDYAVLGVIGESIGTVYLAFDNKLQKLVAIKTFNRSGAVGTSQDREVILKEARKAASLRHPNIVTVYHVGEDFFVMDYIEGESLADVVHNGSLPSKTAVQYVKTISEAIEHAHQRMIWHCDLKPANILMDRDQRIYVTDFHQAKHVGENRRYLPYRAGIGTPAYMAPEQVTGDDLTTATDVYGLGGILYTLLTGSSPCEVEGKTFAEISQLVLREPPVSPRVRNAKVDRDLEAICLKCLRKKKDERYGSPGELVRALELYQAGKETARRWGRLEATSRWCLRNPGPAVLIPAVALVTFVAVVLALLTAKDRKAAQLQEARQSNSVAAKILARNALSEIRELSHIIEKATSDPKLIQDLAGISKKAAGDPNLVKELADTKHPDLERYVKTLCGEVSLIQFQDCFVLDEHGHEVADYRIEGKYQKTPGDLSWRDYFQGAKEHIALGKQTKAPMASDYGNSVHIGKVYRSKTDSLSKLPISAPILDHNGKFLGVICIGVRNGDQLGLVIPQDQRQEVALIAPKDIDSQTETRREKTVILFHREYEPGEDPATTQSPIPQTTQPNHANELNDSEQQPLPSREDYVDPVGSVHDRFRGRWIAGFAPVGNTGIVVIVQQHYEEAMREDPSTRYLRVWAFVVLLLCVIALPVWLWLWRLQENLLIG